MAISWTTEPTRFTRRERIKPRRAKRAHGGRDEQGNVQPPISTIMATGMEWTEQAKPQTTDIDE